MSNYVTVNVSAEVINTRNNLCNCFCTALSRTPAASSPSHSQIAADERPSSTAVIPWHEQYPFGKSVSSTTEYRNYLMHLNASIHLKLNVKVFSVV